MAIVHFPPGLRQYTGGAETAEVKAGQIRHVLREVMQIYPELERERTRCTAGGTVSCVVTNQRGASPARMALPAFPPLASKLPDTVKSLA